MASIARAEPGASPEPLLHKDAGGTLRYADGREAKLWGTNYQAMFSSEYINIQRVRVPHKEAIDRDLDDFVAMEFDIVRLALVDRQIADAEGNLLASDHLDLLDYTIAGCRERGIKVYLVPVSWHPTAWDTTDSFSDRWNLTDLVRNPATWPVQENYLGQVLRHVNPYTGLAFRDDPNIAVWEMLSDPARTNYHQDVVTAQQRNEYFAHFLEIMRSEGVTGIVLGSVYDLTGLDEPQGPPFLASGIDGWAFRDDAGPPDGLTNDENKMGIRSYTTWMMRQKPGMVWMDLPLVKAVSAFDYRGTSLNYMYPAVARSMTASGFQIVCAAQYDANAVAAKNATRRMNFLNYRHWPEKTVSYLIAGRLFRETPLGGEWEQTAGDNWSFDGVTLSHDANRAMYVDEERGIVMYTNSPDGPLPGTLEDYRIVAGANRSSLVDVDGPRLHRLKIDAEGGVIFLDLEPRAERVENPFETGDVHMNYRFCRRVAKLVD